MLSENGFRHFTAFFRHFTAFLEALFSLYAGKKILLHLLDFDRPTKNDIHPTMKPVKLFAYLIENNTGDGDAVLDLFNGSGTTIMACEQTERCAYTMELDPRYVDAAIDRWEKFTGQKAVKIS